MDLTTILIFGLLGTVIVGYLVNEKIREAELSGYYRGQADATKEDTDEDVSSYQARLRLSTIVHTKASTGESLVPNIAAW